MINKSTGFPGAGKGFHPEMVVDESRVIYSEWLKVIAIIAMLIDHVGLALFPQVEALRLIGRIAFPLFAYQIVIGFEHTSDKILMLKRLFWFFGLSQVPYMLLTGTATLNIFATLCLAFLAMMFLERKKYWLLPAVFGFVYLVDVDYGFYGILLILTFYAFRKYRFQNRLLPMFLESYLLIMLTYNYSVFIGAEIQLFALFGVFLAPLLIKIPDSFKLSKRFYYAFYPGHIMGIVILAIML